ncbi:MAG: YfhO family protein [Bacteroidia bacterium]|nr:YfhO family protein [Bacteroidia bacterium]
MNKNNLPIFWQRIWPHCAVILCFVALTCLYFLPVLQGKEIRQGDDINAKGAAQELVEFQKETGEYSQWTNSMFGGMPAYQIRSDSSQNVYKIFNKVARLNLPYTTMGILFMYLLGFYLLLISMNFKPWMSLVGAIAFAFGSYNIIIIIAGHITKAYAIALMPTVLAGVILIFKNKWITGGLYTMVALGMELAYNHVQITYYLGLAILVMIIAELVFAIKSKTLKSFSISCLILLGASILAVLPGTTNMWSTYEYSKLSTRGPSELRSDTEERQHDGLDKDYALDWSYGIHETPTLLIPNIVGGASELIGYDNKAVQAMPPQIRDAVAQQMPKYWGGRSFTSGPVYAGAIICFLFFLGAFYYEGKHKWWLIAATILSIFLAWGKNFMPFTDLMFYYFPMYNKFRTVEMALVIASMTIPLLGFLGLKELFENPERIRYEVGKFFGAMGLTAGFALIIALAPTLFYDFLSDQEYAMFAQLKAGDNGQAYAMFEQGVIDARLELTRSDAWRSVLFIFLGSSALWFFSVGKINAKIALSTLGILILFDLWSIDKRYLAEDDFTPASIGKTEFPISKADKLILADRTPHRVVSLYRDPFNEVSTSYYHHSIGGYHGAKLRRYQDVIDRYIRHEWNAIRQALQSQDIASLEQSLRLSPAMNMLNTKYLIYNPDAEPILNPHALGAAWFVSEVSKADSPDEAIDALGEIDLAKVAVIEHTDIKSLETSADSTATISRSSYRPNEITYSTSSSTPQVAVFSEIYYPAGWKAFIDDKEVEILQADYILRALQVPAGTHEIKFTFYPQSYTAGKLVSIIASVIAVLLLFGGILYNFIKSKKL